MCYTLSELKTIIEFSVKMNLVNLLFFTVCLFGKFGQTARELYKRNVLYENMKMSKTIKLFQLIFQFNDKLTEPFYPFLSAPP